MDRIREFNAKPLLTGKENVSNAAMKEKVRQIYQLFDTKRKAYEAIQGDQQDLEELKKLEQKIEKGDIMNKLCLVLMVLFLLPNTLIAGSLKNEKEMKAFANGVMEKVSKGDIDGAFNALKPYVNLSSTEIDSAAIQPIILTN